MISNGVISPATSNPDRVAGLWASFRAAQTNHAAAASTFCGLRDSTFKEIWRNSGASRAFDEARDKLSETSQVLTAIATALYALYFGHGTDALDAYKVYLTADAAYLAGVHLAAIAPFINGRPADASIAQLRKELDDARHTLSELTNTVVG